MEQVLSELGETAENLVALRDPQEKLLKIGEQELAAQISVVSCLAPSSRVSIKAALLRLQSISTDVFISLNRQDPADGFDFFDAVDSFEINELSIFSH